ncbi:MAG TPA: MBL fold metallo-hydrolase [Opitutus sp.]|nr:MBL fold metallo-hydrolase [Opitutus sp.]
MSLQVVPLKVCHGPFRNFSYLAVDGESRGSFLVDPAWERGRIEDALDRAGSRCGFILLTHSHPDHVDLADALARERGIPVYLSRPEIERYRFDCANLRVLEEADRLPIGGAQVTPILTPGHTLGSMCFLCAGNLFTGDTLFAEGCGMCLGEGANPAALFHSLRKLKATIPPETRIFPGHSYGQPPGQTFARLLGQNIYLQFEKADDFVAYRMRSGQSGWANFV